MKKQEFGSIEHDPFLRQVEGFILAKLPQSALAASEKKGDRPDFRAWIMEELAAENFDAAENIRYRLQQPIRRRARTMTP